MTRSAMAAYNATGPKRALMNPRNARRHPRPEGPRGRRRGRADLQFVAFDLDVDGASHADEQLADRLAALGFTPAAMTVCATVDEALAAIADIEDLRLNGDMDIDARCCASPTSACTSARARAQRPFAARSR